MVAEIGLVTGFCDGIHPARVLKTERRFSTAKYRKAQAARDDDVLAVGVLLNPMKLSAAGRTFTGPGRVFRGRIVRRM